MLSFSEISVIIPAFNEEQGLPGTIEDLKEHCKGCEIIIIDDGSTDKTPEILKNIEGIRVLTHRINRGYGAALKTGIKKASGKVVVWFDSDGQHKAVDMKKIAQPVLEDKVDAIFGSRTKESAFEIKRVPGKWVIRTVSQIVARRTVPDLNCGFRAFKKEQILKYLHLLPNGFSASSTSTLIFIKRGYRIGFEPIITMERQGTSTVKIFRDGFRTLALMWNLFILFDAMLFFGFCSAILLLIGALYSIYIISIVNTGVPVLGAIFIISGILTFFIGVLSSQISQARLERLE